MSLLPEIQSDSPVYLCRFQCYIREAKAVVKFPCSFFVQWSTPNGKNSTMSLRHQKRQDAIPFDQKIYLTTQVIYDNNKKEFLKRDTVIELFLVSKSRPDQNKLVGRTTIDLAKILNVEMYAQPTQFTLNFCSVQGLLTLQFFGLEQKMTQMTVHDLDKSSFIDFISQSALKNQHKNVNSNVNGKVNDYSSDKKKSKHITQHETPKFSLDKRPIAETKTYQIDQRSIIEERRPMSRTSNIRKPEENLTDQKQANFIKSPPLLKNLVSEQSLLDNLSKIQNVVSYTANNINTEEQNTNKLPQDQLLNAYQKPKNSGIIDKKSIIINTSKQVQNIQQNKQFSQQHLTREKIIERQINDVNQQKKDQPVKIKTSQIDHREQSKISDSQLNIKNNISHLQKIPLEQQKKQENNQFEQHHLKQILQKNNKIIANLQLKTKKLQFFLADQRSISMSLSSQIRTYEERIQQFVQQIRQYEHKIEVLQGQNLLKATKIQQLQLQLSQKINNQKEKSSINKSSQYQSKQKQALYIRNMNQLNQLTILYEQLKLNNQQLTTKYEESLASIKELTVALQNIKKTQKTSNILNKPTVQQNIIVVQQEVVEEQVVFNEQVAPLGTAKSIHTINMLQRQEEISKILKSQNQSLIAQKQILLNLNKNYQTQNKQLLYKIENFENKLSSLKQQQSGNSEQQSTSTKINQLAKKQNQKLLSEINRLKTNNQFSMKKMQTQIDSLIKQLSQYEELQSIKQNIEHQKQKIRAQESVLEVNKSILQAEREQIQADQLQLQSDKQQINIQRRQLDQMFIQIQAQKNSIQKNQQKLQNQSANIKHERLTLQSQKLLFDNQKLNIKKMKSDLQYEKTQLARKKSPQPQNAGTDRILQDRLKVYQETISQLNSNLEEQINLNNELSQTIISYMEKQSKMKQTLAVLETQSKQIIQIVKEKESNQEAYQRIIGELQQELKNYVDQNSPKLFKGKLDVPSPIRLSSQSMQGVKNSSQEQTRYLQRAHDNLQEEILQLTANYAENTHKLQAEIQQLKQKITYIEDYSKKGGSAISYTVRQLEKSLKSRDKQLDTWRSRDNQRQEERIRLQSQINALQEMLELAEEEKFSIQSASNLKDIRFQQLSEAYVIIQEELKRIKELSPQVQHQYTQQNHQIRLIAPTQQTVQNRHQDSNLVDTFRLLQERLIPKNMPSDWQTLLQNTLDKSILGQESTKLIQIEEKSRLLSKQLQKLKSQLIKSQWRVPQQKVLVLGLIKQYQKIVAGLISSAQTLNNIKDQSSFL